jgi:hypothetical protein
VLGSSSPLELLVRTGPIAQARLSTPGGLAVLAPGVLALTDSNEHVVLLADGL